MRAGQTLYDRVPAVQLLVCCVGVAAASYQPCWRQQLRLRSSARGPAVATVVVFVLVMMNSTQFADYNLPQDPAKMAGGSSSGSAAALVSLLLLLF
jgi:hypothetical protein